jgi:hypothetical protein
MRVILHSWCQIQRTSSSLRNVTCGPDHIQSIFCTAYLGFNIQNEGSSLSIIGISTIQWAFYCKLGANYSPVPLAFAMWTVVPHVYNVFTAPQYSILNIRLNVSALLLEICRYLHACDTANFVPNTEPNLRFALCEMWSRTYTMHLQLRMFSLQYSTEPICATIGDNRTCRCALYCLLGAKYSPHPPVYAMRTMVPDIYNAFTAPYIQTSIFISPYLPCYCTYHDNSMRVILQTY